MVALRFLYLGLLIGTTFGLPVYPRSQTYDVGDIASREPGSTPSVPWVDKRGRGRVTRRITLSPVGPTNNTVRAQRRVYQPYNTGGKDRSPSPYNLPALPGQAGHGYHIPSPTPSDDSEGSPGPPIPPGPPGRAGHGYHPPRSPAPSYHSGVRDHSPSPPGPPGLPGPADDITSAH